MIMRDSLRNLSGVFPGFFDGYLKEFRPGFIESCWDSFIDLLRISLRNSVRDPFYNCPEISSLIPVMIFLWFRGFFPFPFRYSSRDSLRESFCSFLCAFSGIPPQISPAFFHLYFPDFLQRFLPRFLLEFLTIFFHSRFCSNPFGFLLVFLSVFLPRFLLVFL